MTAHEETRAEALSDNVFWSYHDLAFFISVTFLSVIASTVVVAILRPRNRVITVLLLQIIVYALIAASLFVLLRLRYGRPFWQALGFRYPRYAAWICAFLGPALAIAIGVLGLLLHAREIELPFQDLLQTRSAVILLGILVVVLGPFCEELVFRGFLMPLFARSLGAAGGIVLAGVLFGCMHGPEYSWSWQHVVLISFAGIVFGYARYAARSTLAAVMMHATFNLTQFAAFVFAEHAK